MLKNRINNHICIDIYCTDLVHKWLILFLNIVPSLSAYIDQSIPDLKYSMNWLVIIDSTILKSICTLYWIYKPFLNSKTCYPLIFTKALTCYELLQVNRMIALMSHSYLDLYIHVSHSVKFYIKLVIVLWISLLCRVIVTSITYYVTLYFTISSYLFVRVR